MKRLWIVPQPNPSKLKLRVLIFKNISISPSTKSKSLCNKKVEKKAKRWEMIRFHNGY